MIVATAGHVDHGKTSLVGHLTGVDTDRLAAEKTRGLTIEPGFAYREFGGRTVGFIDVPGHHRFVNNMIAGIGGIDLALLVVAADDGPMPQTLEHLDILRVLGVDRYAVVITKGDRVEAGRIATVHEQVSDLFTARGAAVPAMFNVSNVTGEGLAELAGHLDDCARAHRERPARGYFRLPVDRAFVLRGRGLVVTGTAIAGRIRVGETLRLLPQGRAVRVRSIHVQDTPAEEARAGLRCALNIAGDIERKDIARGDWLTGNPAAKPTRCLDARFHLLERNSLSLKPMAPVKLYIGSRRVAARLTSLEGSHLHPGDSALIQLLADQPLVCCRGDRFLIRDHGEQITLGGGSVLAPWAVRRGKARPERIAYLQAMGADDDATALRAALSRLESGIDYESFRLACNLDEAEERKLLAHFDAGELTFVDGGRHAIASERWHDLQGRVLASVAAWHARNPAAKGIEAGELCEQLPGCDRSLCECCLAVLVKEGRLVPEGNAYRLAGHTVGLTGRDRQLWDSISAFLEKTDVQVPVVHEVAAGTGLDGRVVSAVFRAAAKHGLAVKVTDNRFIPRSVFDRLVASAESLARRHGSFTVVDFKNENGLGRNFAIEFLDYLDAQGLTAREGNARRFRPTALAAGARRTG